MEGVFKRVPERSQFIGDITNIWSLSFTLNNSWLKTKRDKKCRVLLQIFKPHLVDIEQISSTHAKVILEPLSVVLVIL